MSKVLLTFVVMPRGAMYPGQGVSDDQVTAVTSAGGTLADTSDANIASAAVLCQSLQGSYGDDIGLLATIMQQGVNASQLTASAQPKVNVAADGSAGATVAETYFDTFFGTGTYDVAVSARGTATASDTTYASILVRLYRAGSVVKTWTITTKTTASAGTGNWASGALFKAGSPFQVQPGDYLTYEQDKASSGVSLPVHAIGLYRTA